MSEYNAKNYVEPGGDVTHIGGKLVIDEGASVEGLPMPEGGGNLPDVTSADNGKFLGVANGQWDKVNVAVELPVLTINVTGTTLGANVQVTFPQGFSRSDIQAYAAGPRSYILKVNYMGRELEFSGYDGNNAIFRNFETMRSESDQLDELVVIIPFVINGYLRDKVFRKNFQSA